MDESNSSTPATSNSSSNMSNSKTILIVVAVVVLLILAGGAYAFKSQIKSMMMPESAETTEETGVSETSQIPEPSAPTDETPTNPAMTQKSTDAAMVVKSVEVDYSATGFSPKSVTIKKGEMVKFVNKSGNPMSVASDPHPTHTILPELDQYKSTSKGKEEYDFTFTKVGSWGYHNHMNPDDTGTVVVTE